MPLRVVATLEGRYEDRLAATTAGFYAATDRAVSRWTFVDDVLDDTVVRVGDELHPGPLAVLPDGRVAWGPTVLDADRPAWPVADLLRAATADLGEGAARRFDLRAGAVSGDGTQVALVLVRPRSRAVSGADRDVGLPPHRVAVVATDATHAVELLDVDRVPTSLAWGDGPLLLGLAGKVDVRGGAPLTIGDGTAARSLAPSSTGTLAAGAATGRIYTRALEWSAHDGPVTALAWSPDGARLASGGEDGRLRVWSTDATSEEDVELGGEVEAAAWIDDGTIVAKWGGQGGTLALLRR